MKQSLSLFITFLFVSIGVQSQDYKFKKGDPYGIGKWYLGREIAYVMGYQGISWLERSTRQKEEDTEQLIKTWRFNQQMSLLISALVLGIMYLKWFH